MGKTVTSNTSTVIVLILFFCLIGLICLLIFLYKKLNREAKGEYTIQRMIYKEGGVRDRVRGAALALGTCVGIQLWPCNDTNEDEEEMQDFQDEEGQVEAGGSQGSDTEGEDEQEEDDTVNNNNSSLEVSEAEEQAGLTDVPEAKEEIEKKGEEKQEKVGEEQDKQETSGGAGLLIDLKHFSGSAIWSEEEGGKGKGGDMTAL